MSWIAGHGEVDTRTKRIKAGVKWSDRIERSCGKRLDKKSGTRMVVIQKSSLVKVQVISPARSLSFGP